MNRRPRGFHASLFTLYSLALILLFCSKVSAQDVPYTTGNWNAAEFGNHRARVRVVSEADAVWVRIPWRRRDQDPEKKNIIVVDSRTGNRVANLVRVDINREFGNLVFQPQTAPGEYHVYYLPYESSGGSYPRVRYPEPESTTDEAWLQRNELTPEAIAGERWKGLPKAETIELQSIDDFHSFWPMEVIATRTEMEELHSRHAGLTYLVFPEDRAFSIRMTDDLPQKWIMSGPAVALTGTAMRGEFYAFQLGVYAMRRSLENLELEFTPLQADNRRGSIRGSIPASAFTCFNLGGVDWTGKEYSRELSVEIGKVQALWCGVQIPYDAVPGKYRCEILVSARGVETQNVKGRLLSRS